MASFSSSSIMPNTPEQQSGQRSDKLSQATPTSDWNASSSSSTLVQADAPISYQGRSLFFFGLVGCAHGDKAGASIRHSLPIRVPGLHNKRIQQISCGPYHAAAVTKEGHLFTWGSGFSGQLAHGHLDDVPFPQVVKSAVLNKALHMRRSVSVSCGGAHTVFVDHDGVAFACGGNKDGQLGHLKMYDPSVAFPVEPLLGRRVESVACGGMHTLFLDDTGRVFACGKGENGRLGLGHCQAVTSPMQISALSQYFVRSIACGWSSSMAVVAGKRSTCDGPGLVMTWGCGGGGRLGHGSEVDVWSPRIVEELRRLQVHVVEVSSGHRHCACRSGNGQVWVWGSGPAAHFDSSESSIPARMSAGALGPGSHALQVACGGAHCIALLDTGLVATWGHGSSGQLGTGDRGDCALPTVVASLRGITARSVAAGWDCSLVVADESCLLGSAGTVSVSPIVDILENDAAGELSSHGYDPQTHTHSKYSRQHSSEGFVVTISGSRIINTVRYYGLQVFQSNESWTVVKRYSECLKLADALDKYLGDAVVPPFPPKQTIAKLLQSKEQEDRLVETRQHALQAWFDAVTEALRESAPAELSNFFEIARKPGRRLLGANGAAIIPDVTLKSGVARSEATFAIPPPHSQFGSSMSQSASGVSSEDGVLSSKCSEVDIDDVSTFQREGSRPQPPSVQVGTRSFSFDETAGHGMVEEAEVVDGDEFFDANEDCLMSSLHSEEVDERVVGLHVERGQNESGNSSGSGNSADFSRSTPSTVHSNLKPAESSADGEDFFKPFAISTNSYKDSVSHFRPDSYVFSAEEVKSKSSTAFPGCGGLIDSFLRSKSSSSRKSPNADCATTSPGSAGSSPGRTSDSPFALWAGSGPWTQEILPRWHKQKNKASVRSKWRRGVPACVRGRVWSLAIGNQAQVSKDLFDILRTQARQMLQPHSNENDERGGPLLHRQSPWVSEEPGSGYRPPSVMGLRHKTSPNKEGAGQQMQQVQFEEKVQAEWLSGFHPVDYSSVDGVDGDEMISAVEVHLHSRGSIGRNSERHSSVQSSSLVGRDSIPLIKVDVVRTLPALRLFQEGCPYDDVLLDILGAFALYRPDIGYVQGMSYIASVLVMFLPSEVSAFTALCNLLGRPVFQAFFRANRRPLQYRLSIFDQILRVNCPEVHSHLSKLEIAHTMFLTSWMKTLFIKSLPLTTASKVIDCYLCDGEMVLYRIAVALLKLVEKRIIGQTLEDTMRVIQSGFGRLSWSTLLPALRAVAVPLASKQLLSRFEFQDELEQ